MRVILASRSPARCETLRRAGLDPEVIVSDFDEDSVTGASPAELAGTLARCKGAVVASQLDGGDDLVLVACDSVLELDGVAYGKPGSARVAAERWRLMSGRSGVLHTGHHVLVRLAGRDHVADAVASTVVHFADLDDAEVAAYASSGEPEQVAGAFTLDGLGGAYVTGIEGDPHNVVGISLPLLRRMLAGLGVPWHTLWTRPPAG